MKKILNFMKSSKIKFICIISFLLLLYTYLCVSSYTYAISQDLSSNLFRLHVIANSDSKEDQDLKYIVRNHLIDYMNTLCSNCTSKQEAIELASSHKDQFYIIAKKVISDYGYSYPVEIEIGNFEFPTKTYGDISLPSGNYDALRVKIGEAKGQNWWCVMFPPLCFIDVSSGIVPEESKQYMKDNLSKEEFALISNSSESDIQFKFKLLELFSNSNFLTAKK